MVGKNENFIFLKKMMRNPRQIGAIFPSSQNLGEMMCRFIPVTADHKVIEIGAGTGSLTKTLIQCGISLENLIILELDADLCAHLRRKFPQIQVIQGNAVDLKSLLPASWIGDVGTVISGIPMINLSFTVQKQIVDACFNVARPGAQILQFTYGPMSPLPAQRLEIYAQRLGHVFFNMPPASLWRFTREPARILLSAYKRHTQSPLDKIRKLSLFGKKA